MNKKYHVLLILVVLFLFFAGILAITQEAPDVADEVSDDEDFDPEDIAFEFQIEDEFFSDWVPPGPPRWFRSNAGGMSLEETPSRLAALRNKYALVIDYSHPSDIDPRLAQFYRDDCIVEIRILYEKGREHRKQWIFRDEAGIILLNAVFRPPAEDEPVDEEATVGQLPDNEQADEEAMAGQLSDDDQTDEDAVIVQLSENDQTDIIDNDIDDDDAEYIEGFVDVLIDDYYDDEDIPESETPPEVIARGDEPAPVGFIELFNEKGQIIEDRWLFDDESEMHISYAYNGNTLIRSETRKMIPDDAAFLRMYTDNYRYNRSYSLRHVERVYHEGVSAEPVRLDFPNRVLEAAVNQSFISDPLTFNPDFFESFYAEAGSRMIYDLDDKGRILTQTMLDADDEIIWTVQNTWTGERITASLRTEGEDVKRTEYEYDGSGKRIVQRDINNGVLERVIYTDGNNETEELYMNGAVVLRAYWENGRKINEERVRVGGRAQEGGR